MRPALTLRDLVAESEFGLNVLVGVEALEAPVEGIHLSELQDPTPWMLPRSLLLSTGLNIVLDATFGERLVDIMSDAGMAGIGVALGHYLDELPESMAARARERGLPLFTVPMDVPFRRITAHVYYALSSQDSYRLRRTLSLQSHLLELLLEERGPSELVVQLADLLETSVFLFDGGGELVAEAQAQARFSPQGRRALWGAYLEHRARREVLPAFQLSGFRVSYREASLYGRVDRVLVAAYPNRPIPELAETTLSFAQKLLTLDRLRERDVAALRSRMRTGLLDDLVSGIGAERDLAERMAYHGIDPARGWRVAVLDIADVAGRQAGEGPRVTPEWIPAAQTAVTAMPRRGASPTGDAAPGKSGVAGSLSAGRSEEQIQELKTLFLESVDRFLGDHGLPYLTVPKSDTVVALIQFPDTERAAAERTLVPLCRRAEEEVSGISVSIGVSSPGRGPMGVAAAFRQALEAVAPAKSSRRQGGQAIRFFDQMHPQARLLELQSAEGLSAIYQDTVAPLVEHDRSRNSRLVDTLRVFLGSGRSVRRASEVLHMHRNTLTKRLERIEAILGLSLESNDDLVSLTLGLRAYDMLERARGL